MSYRREKEPNGDYALVIDGWEKGTGASPEAGLNIQNCNIESFTGVVRANWALSQESVSPFTGTFTANASNEIITLSVSGSFDQQAVRFTTTGTLPAPLATATTYWLIASGGQPTVTYKVATTLANALSGTAIDIADAGSGTHTVSNTDTTVAMGTINYFLNVPVITSGSPTFYQFALDSGGKVWFRNPSAVWVLVAGNTTSNASGNGLACFTSSGGTTYLFAIRNNSMDVLNVSTFVGALSPTWTNGWFALSSPAGFTGSHAALWGQDNIVYVCDINFIASISEKVGQNFDPSSGATYTQASKALTLPSYSSAQCLEELSQNLLIGDMNTNYIYPWDRLSTSFQIPLRVAETNVYKLKNVDNTIFALVGTKGHVYQTTGYSFFKEIKIPEYISGGTVSWGGMEKVSGALIFGVSMGGVSNTAGVYRLYTSAGNYPGSIVGSLICDQTPLNGSSNAVLPTALLTPVTPTEFYWVGINGYIYKVSNTTRPSTFVAYVESEVIPIGSFLQKKTLANLEYKLDYAPTAGNIRISWRSNLNSSYTYITASGGDSVIGKISDVYSNMGIDEQQWLQIKVELDGGTAIDTPRLREIRLR